jgi:hypothetical protein
MIVYRGTSSRDIKDIATKGIEPYLDTSLASRTRKHYRSSDGIDASVIPVVNVTNSELIAKQYAYYKCYGAVINKSMLKIGIANASSDPLFTMMTKGTPVIVKMSIPDKDLHFLTYDTFNAKASSYMITRNITPKEIITISTVKESFRELLKQMIKAGNFSSDELKWYIPLSYASSIDRAIKEEFED